MKIIKNTQEDTFLYVREKRELELVVRGTVRKTSYLASHSRDFIFQYYGDLG